MSVLEALQPAVVTFLQGRHEKLVSAECVGAAVLLSDRSSPRSSSKPLSTAASGTWLADSRHSSAASSAASLNLVPTILALGVPVLRLTTGPAAHLRPGTLYMLDIRSGNQIRLRHALPLSRLLCTAAHVANQVNLTFDFGASGLFSVQFESHIQREMFVGALQRWMGGTAGDSTSGIAATKAATKAGPLGTSSSGAAVDLPEHLTGLLSGGSVGQALTVEEEERLVTLMQDEAGLEDNARYFQDSLLHREKAAELRLLQTLITSTPKWIALQKTLGGLREEVRELQERIALHAANLLAKRMIIQGIERNNNALQRKQHNLSSLQDAMKELKGLLELDPALEDTLTRLRVTPDEQLPAFFEKPENVRGLCEAMEHMRGVIQDADLQRSFPIAAVQQRKKYFFEQRGMIVFRSKSFLFSLLDRYEASYWKHRRAPRGAFAWASHDGLHDPLLQMREILHATARIDIEGFMGLLRRYRVVLRRMYAAEFGALWEAVWTQMETGSVLRLGERHSSAWYVRFRSLLHHPGDVLPPRGELPVPSHREYLQQHPPLAAGGDVMSGPQSPFSDHRASVLGMPVAAFAPKDCIKAALPVFGLSSLASSATVSRSGLYAAGLQLFARPQEALEVFCQRVKRNKRNHSLTAWLLGGCMSGLGIGDGGGRAALNTRRKGGRLRPDIAFSIALQSTLLAILVEESVLAQCFGIEESCTASHHSAFVEEAMRHGGGAGRQPGEASPSLAPPKEVPRSSSPGLLLESLLELFSGDNPSFSIGQVMNTLGAAAVGTSGTTKPREEAAVHEGSAPAEEGGVDQTYDIHAQKILRQHYLVQHMTRLARYLVRYCDKMFVVPILCMIRALAAPLEEASSPSPPPSDGEEPLRAPSSTSRLSCFLLREVETVLAGGMVDHLSEQTLSIHKAKRAYRVRPTPLFVALENFPLYVWRMEALMNGLSPNVCDDAQCLSILVRIADQLFSAMDELFRLEDDRVKQKKIKSRVKRSRKENKKKRKKEMEEMDEEEEEEGGSFSLPSPSTPQRGGLREDSDDAVLNLPERLQHKLFLWTGESAGFEAQLCAVIQQYRHHAFFCTFFRSLSPQSRATGALRNFFDYASVRRGCFERIYLEQWLLHRELPVFASFTAAVRELLDLYSESELLHHRAVSLDAIKHVIAMLPTELPAGIAAIEGCMRSHLLSDVPPDAEAVVFHRVLLQKTWALFGELLLKRYDLLCRVVSWERYAKEGVMVGVTREQVIRWLNHEL